jgi:chemotaxis protein MotB
MNKSPITCAAVAAVLLAGCVSQEKYNESQQNLATSQQKNQDLEQEYQQLNQSMSAEVSAQQMQISRLQNAVKVSVDSGGLMKLGITSNLILSQKRADDVTQYMISQGVKPSLISAQGFGESNPVASNDTAAGRAQNRRVEITLANASG